MAEPLLTRDGVAHPVVVLRALDGSPERVLLDDGLPLEVDPALLEAGIAHREAVLRAAPATWNGSILGFRALRGDTVVAGRTDYFTMLATSDALRAERERHGEAGPLRARARRAAGGDPLRSGAGRASVVGLSVLTVLTHDGAAWLLLGRRSRDLAISPGLVGTIDGCTEPGTTDRPLRENIARELAEEAPGAVALSGRDAGALAGSARLQGLTMNVLRLSPTISVEIRIPLAEPPERADLLSPDEFAGQVLVEATPRGLARLWRDGRELAPPAAGALALWERRYFE